MTASLPGVVSLAQNHPGSRVAAAPDVGQHCTTAGTFEAGVVPVFVKCMQEESLHDFTCWAFSHEPMREKQEKERKKDEINYLYCITPLELSIELFNLLMRFMRDVSRPLLPLHQPPQFDFRTQKMLHWNGIPLQKKVSLYSFLFVFSFSMNFMMDHRNIFLKWSFFATRERNRIDPPLCN